MVEAAVQANLLIQSSCGFSLAQGHVGLNSPRQGIEPETLQIQDGHNEPIRAMIDQCTFVAFTWLLFIRGTCSLWQ